MTDYKQAEDALETGAKAAAKVAELERKLSEARQETRLARATASNLEAALKQTDAALAEARAETDAATLDRDKADQARKNTACAVVIAQERIAGLERRLAEVKRWAEESDAGRDREIRRASRLRSRLARVLRVAIHPDMPEWIPGVWSSKVNGGSRNG